MLSFKPTIVLTTAIALMGCATVKPTASAQLNYALPFSTDYWQHSDRSWQCEQPQFRGEVGGITKKGWGFGAYHESMVLCGTGNTKPELFENGLYVKKEWGGWH